MEAVTINLPIFAVKPLNPDLTFKHISVHVVHTLARMIAKEAIKAQLRYDGVRVQFVKPRDINERATPREARHNVDRELMCPGQLVISGNHGAV